MGGVSSGVGTAELMLRVQVRFLRPIAPVPLAEVRIRAGHREVDDGGAKARGLLRQPTGMEYMPLSDT